MQRDEINKTQEDQLQDIIIKHTTAKDFQKRSAPADLTEHPKRVVN